MGALRLAIITIVMLQVFLVSMASYAAPTGTNTGMGWSCTAGGSRCTCEGGKDSLDCKDMVKYDYGICWDVKPNPTDVLTCDIHGRCSCEVNPPSEAPPEQKTRTGKTQGISMQYKSVPAYSERISGNDGLEWNCSSGSTTCTCSGGEGSDDCDALMDRMCSDSLNPFKCNAAGTCSNCTAAGTCSCTKKSSRAVNNPKMNTRSDTTAIKQTSKPVSDAPHDYRYRPPPKGQYINSPMVVTPDNQQRPTTSSTRALMAPATASCGRSGDGLRCTFSGKNYNCDLRRMNCNPVSSDSGVKVRRRSR